MKENSFEGKIGVKFEIEKQIVATQKYSVDEYTFFINGLAYYIFEGAYCLISDNNYTRLGELYKTNNLNFYEYLAGDYDIAVWDSKKNIWIVFQGDLSSNTLYYFMEKQVFLFDVSLRKLLLRTNMKRDLNVKAAEELISNGYVVGEETLIQGIYKLPPMYILVYDTEKNDLCAVCKKKAKHKYPYNKANTKIQYEQYEEYFNFFESRIKDKLWALCLSAGYDSNFLLLYLRKHFSQEIMTLTAGGKIGKNEIYNVNRILSIYNGIIHHEYVIDSSILEELPDVVWQLEGCVYDKGIFLDYVLAKKAEELGINTVILGEGHDEIHNLEEKESFMIYDILKKSSIFFSNRGIQTIRPYLDKNIVQMVCEASEEDRKEKHIFKKYVESLLPDDIAALLRTCGGSIDLETIFQNEQIFERCRELVKNSEIFSHREINNLYKKIGNRKQVILGCLYVSAFAKLYISGLYDTKFFNRSIDVELETLLGEK